MIYVMSDLHGCFEKYKKMLKEIDFSSRDILYVLGDIIDRGENGGIDILLDMMGRRNVIPLCGNHEYMARSMLVDICYPKDENQRGYFADGKINADDYEFMLWMMNGGQTTLDAFLALPDMKKKAVIEYIGSFMMFEELTVGNNKFFLSHTVPEKNVMDNFDDMDFESLLFPYPEYDKVYYEDKYIVTGHVPTFYTDADSSGRIYRKNNHIAIDCGAVFGKTLGCIRLDDFKEFYV